MTLYIAVLMILFVSTFTRSALGFGDAVIAMPLLAMAVGIQTATPLVAFAAVTISISILCKNWHVADMKATWKLVLSSLAGIPLGLLMLKGVSEDLMKGVLGTIIALYGVYNLIRPNIILRQDRFGLSYIFGFIAGVLGGAYNTNGPMVAIYGTIRHWPPRHFRATMQGYFLPTGFLILLGHGVSGLWTQKVLILYVLALPVVLLAVYLGGKANRSLPQEQFKKYIYSILIIMGLILVWKSLPF